MRFAGSGKADLVCYECQGVSEPFRFWWSEDEEEGRTWNGPTPDGWELDESEARMEYYDGKGEYLESSRGKTGTVFALCPTCAAKEKGDGGI